MPEIISIGGNDIEKGQNVKINLTVARLPSSTVIDIPVFIYRSKNPGPVLLLMAGMHGDEVNGMEIIRRIVVDKAIFPTNGTIIAIPILNVFGFLNYSREVPDGKDVNRSFPGSKRGSLASRIAAIFMDEIFPHVDYGLDFHTGWGNRYYYPQTRSKFDIESHYELAKAFGAPFRLNAKLRDKSLRKEATLKGKPIIVYEAGEAQRMDEFAITEGVNGALRVMKHLGMTDKVAPEYGKSIELTSSSWIRANRSGLFRSFVKPGDEIKRNQVLGTIADPFGAIEIKVKAPKKGFIVGLNYSPVVSQGDALIHIGLV